MNNTSDKKVKRSAASKLGKYGTALIATAAVLVMVIAGTLAYMTFTTDNPIRNLFKTGDVQGDIIETFDGTYKSSIKVKNTGEKDDLAVYARVNLVTYRVDENINSAAGDAEITWENASLDERYWKEGSDGFYYYLEKLLPGETSEDMIDLAGTPGGIKLQEYEDGTKQEVDVLVQFIQAGGADEEGTPAVTDAWGIEVDDSGKLIVE